MNFINKTLSKIFGSKSDSDLKELRPIVILINQEKDRVSQLSIDELRNETAILKNKIKEFIKIEQDQIDAFKEEIESGKLSIADREDTYNNIDKLEEVIDGKIEEVLTEILPVAFAVMRETARRFTDNSELEVIANDFDRELSTRYDNVQIDGDKAVYFNTWNAGGNEILWNMVHYDVQLIGGTVLHNGKIAEMATGEGKTLVATLPVFLNALTGRGVHLVTVNDYLAKRDSEWMGPIYQFHGLSVDCIDKHEPNSDERRKAYRADITFGTNNEFGFDYLRDNMATNPKDLVQRRHNYAIVDEVDSVLVDDARTPLIISGPVPKGDKQQFDELKPMVAKLVKAQADLVNKTFIEGKKLLKSDDKKDKEQGAVLLLRTFKGLPKTKALIKFLSEQGNKATLIKTENFYMQENNKNMHIITDDLYFVIDEKHNSIDLTDKGVELLSADTHDPEFFILPEISLELDEIEKQDISDEEKVIQKDEFLQIYSLKSERVHTANQLLKAYTLFERDVEYVLVDNKVKIVDEQTGRIMDGRRYSDGLHQALEAKENVKIEAATQTFATVTLQNYFRMYHKLSGMTGTAETEAGELWDIYKLDVVVVPTNRPIARLDHEDLVYKTKREKYTGVIEEVVKLVESGRPVLVGTTSVEISELLGRMLKMRGIKHNVLNAKLHQREAEIVAEAGQKGIVTIATNMAGRGTDIKLSDEVKAAGGLAIVGTERHDSRRVDRQLRGRAGRQGDVGSSQFFVSLEDDLMRLFSSDRIVKLMDRMGLEDGEVIQHSMISKSIERAQRKIEENNFGIRKRLLEYDDVMNSQREVIYKRRKHALLGERIQVDIANMISDVCENISDDFAGGDYDEFKQELIRTLSIESPVTKQELAKINPEALTNKLNKLATQAYKRKVEIIGLQAMPVIKEVYESKGDVFENIVVPITDGQKMFQVVTNLEKAYKTQGDDLVRSYEKVAVLSTIDNSWKEHLREMDDLKQSVQNATYEQKDPLLIYKFESFNLFKIMIGGVNKAIVSTLMKGQIPMQDAEDIHEAQERKRTDMSRMKTSSSNDSEETATTRKPKKLEPVRHAPKVGRNEACPCGSGKKYKQCHGK